MNAGIDKDNGKLRRHLGGEVHQDAGGFLHGGLNRDATCAKVVGGPLQDSFGMGSEEAGVEGGEVFAKGREIGARRVEGGIGGWAEMGGGGGGSFHG